MNNTSRETRAQVSGGRSSQSAQEPTAQGRGARRAAPARLKAALPLMLCALAAGRASWAQGYGTGAAGRTITPGSIPGSNSPSMARPGSGDTGGSAIYTSPVASPIKARERYPLGPEDVIVVTVERFPDFSTNNIVIPPDGRLSLPYFGTLNVNEKTAPELENILTSRINRRIRNPKVSVSIVRFRSAILGYINVIGAVQAQGAVEILEGFRLTEIMAKVGGVRGRYDEVEAVLTRGRGTGKEERIPIDLYKAISYPQSAANKLVMADDVLNITSVDFGRIAVSGDVGRQGVYELRKVPAANAAELPLKPRLSDLLVAVGGFINNDKLLNGRTGGFVQRGVERIPLRVSDAIDFKDESANILLKPNDFVTLTVEPPLPINVLGLVRVPGAYRVRPGSGVLEATTLAGGLARDPLQTLAVLQRNGSTRTIDLAKMLAGDMTQNLTLEAGDTINLTSPDTLQVAISGAVAEPSKEAGLSLAPGSTISTAIAKAGGTRLTPDRLSITVIRTMPDGSQKFLSVDAVALQERNDPSQNVKLQSGDIINVLEKRLRQAAIAGEIFKSGQYTVDENGEDLATFIAGAGGVRPTASLRAVNIKRADGSVLTVDAYEAVVNGRPLNVIVHENDLVSIAPNLNKILVSGAVRSEGAQLLPEGRPLSVLDAITAAGGALPGARLQEVILIRARPDGKGGFTPETRKLNLSEVRKGNLSDAQITLQNGDILVVPDPKVKQNPISQGLGLFSIFNIARSLFGR